jgi:predicted nucleic acid-binding Zn ribbon protein
MKRFNASDDKNMLKKIKVESTTRSRYFCLWCSDSIIGDLALFCNQKCIDQAHENDMLCGLVSAGNDLFGTTFDVPLTTKQRLDPPRTCVWCSDAILNKGIEAFCSHVCVREAYENRMIEQLTYHASEYYDISFTVPKVVNTTI